MGVAERIVVRFLVLWILGWWVGRLRTVTASADNPSDLTRSGMILRQQGLTLVSPRQSLGSPTSVVHKPNWRSDKQVANQVTDNKQPSSNKQQGATSLSDSSSSPVQPIKPLLDLSLGDPNGSLTVPLHPVFDEAAPRNVSSMASNTAYLHCLVHNLGNKSVSWIRQRDLHILTVGRYTYTTDQRYEVINSPSGSKDWILKIKYAQVRDSGNYECQVSTKPVRSYVVHLHIFKPQARIIGAPEFHVDKSSAINLTCIISYSPEPPTYIFWYHNGKVLSFDSPRGGITVATDRGNTTTGYLLLQDAQVSDTGNYTCKPSNTAATAIRVHVLNGETPAAMQTNGAESLLPCSVLSLLVALCCLMVLQEGPPLPSRLRGPAGDTKAGDQEDGNTGDNELEAREVGSRKTGDREGKDREMGDQKAGGHTEGDRKFGNRAAGVDQGDEPSTVEEEEGDSVDVNKDEDKCSDDIQTNWHCSFSLTSLAHSRLG